MLIGDVAAAANGWPVTLASGVYLIAPEDATRNLERLEEVASALGAGERQVEDPYGGLDITIRWPLPGGGSLAAAPQPVGTRGYRDLRKNAHLVALEHAVVQLASIRDLVRIADATPYPDRRVYLPALWATLEQIEAHEQAHLDAA